MFNLSIIHMSVFYSFCANSFYTLCNIKYDFIILYCFNKCFKMSIQYLFCFVHQCRMLKARGDRDNLEYFFSYFSTKYAFSWQNGSNEGSNK